jgi:hypothetical protein
MLWFIYYYVRVFCGSLYWSVDGRYYGVVSVDAIIYPALAMWWAGLIVACRRACSIHTSPRRGSTWHSPSHSPFAMAVRIPCDGDTTRPTPSILRVSCHSLIWIVKGYILLDFLILDSGVCALVSGVAFYGVVGFTAQAYIEGYPSLTLYLQGTLALTR